MSAARRSSVAAASGKHDSLTKSEEYSIERDVGESLRSLVRSSQTVMKNARGCWMTSWGHSRIRIDRGTVFLHLGLAGLLTVASCAWPGDALLKDRAAQPASAVWVAPPVIDDQEVLNRAVARLAPIYKVNRIDIVQRRMETAYRTLETCWGGFTEMAFVPCRRARAALQLQGSQPLHVNVTVQSEAASCNGTWLPMPTSVELASEIVNLLAAEFAAPKDMR